MRDFIEQVEVGLDLLIDGAYAQIDKGIEQALSDFSNLLVEENDAIARVEFNSEDSESSDYEESCDEIIDRFRQLGRENQEVINLFVKQRALIDEIQAFTMHRISEYRKNSK